MGRQTIPLLLVVDDDSTTADELTRWLRQQGYNAVAAASCLEARAIVEAIPVDCMIGQLALPDGSLFEIAQALRSKEGRTTIIGYADVDVRPPPELDACFVRPLDLSVLDRFLGVRLGRRRSGELARLDMKHSVPAAVPLQTKSAARRR
jgi:CheY-like chemotaxis protein